MRYQEVFSIQIIHQFYSGKEWLDMMIVPDKATLQIIKEQHLHLKSILNGVSVLVDADAPAPVLSFKDKLGFEVYPTSGAFYMYTDLADLQPGECLVFSNEPPPDDFRLTTTITPTAGQCMNGFQIAARVEIHPTTGLLDLTTARPYTIHFRAKSATWKYYFITRAGDTNLLIADTGTAPLQFNKLEVQDESSDPVLTALQLNFPKAEFSVFESGTPVPAQHKGRKHIALMQDGQTLIRHLPNPTAAEQEIKIIKLF